MSDLGRIGSNTLNSTITFDLNGTCNDSSTLLLDAISEQLIDISFDDAWSITDITIYSNETPNNALCITNNYIIE